MFLKKIKDLEDVLEMNVTFLFNKKLNKGQRKRLK